MREMLIGLLRVLCVVLGAILQHVLAKSKERDSQFANIRHESYSDYLRAVSAVAKTRSPESISQLTDAKARMAIYASDEVIELLAEFEISGVKGRHGWNLYSNSPPAPPLRRNASPSPGANS